MATPGGTPTPDLPPLGICSGLPLIPCPDCGGFVEEYIPGLGGSITRNPCKYGRNETGRHGGCSFFKTQEEYEAILRDRGLLGPAATPEQRSSYPILVQAPSGFLVPEPVGNPEMVAAMEDLKHEVVVQELAIAQLKTDIEDFMGKLGAGDKVEKATKNKLAITQLETDIGAGDKVQKAALLDALVRWVKAIVKWFVMANVIVLLFCIVFGMSV